MKKEAIMIKEKTMITFKEMIQETSDIYSFVFEVPETFHWLPGQHGVFRFTQDLEMTGKSFRIFSFASVEEEHKMLFSTRIAEPISDFKKHLLQLKAGDTMTIDGAVGKFLLNDLSKPTCIMAGGIGITPVRAFMKQVEYSKENPCSLEILYSDDRGEFAYEHDLNTINNNFSGVHLQYISDRNIFTEKIESYAKDHQNESLYYIAGTPGMNKFLTEKLISLGIESQHIITDIFTGYGD